MTGAEMQRWDEWFAAVNDEESSRAWEAAKKTLQPEALDTWATIIEINRLNRVLSPDAAHKQEEPGSSK